MGLLEAGDTSLSVEAAPHDITITMIDMEGTMLARLSPIQVEQLIRDLKMAIYRATHDEKGKPR